MKVVRLDDCINEIKSLDNNGCITRSTNHICEDIRNEVKEFDAIPIPEGATNGDMIKAVFGAKDKDENFVIQTITVTMCGIRKTFSRDWWYAQYKKEVEE
jgi:hypothetical protein